MPNPKRFLIQDIFEVDSRAILPDSDKLLNRMKSSLKNAASKTVSHNTSKRALQTRENELKDIVSRFRPRT